MRLFRGMRLAAETARRACDVDAPLVAFTWYGVATIAMTWPLVLSLTTRLPADLGDPLLNTWILGWGVDHIARFVTGDLGAFRGFWDANIFYPAPLALAYSEHLFAQALQVTPVWMATGNLLLCYNLLFLSSFVLSAFGAYLLARDLLGSGRAAFVAGLLYGFALYRVAHFPHLQVLSSQWMPFALVGLGRFARSGRLWPLAGGAGALVAQNLSNGYYMVYFTPFLVAYVLWQMARAGRLLDWRRWLPLSAAAATVVAACWPFIQPYLELRRIGFGARRLAEVDFFSADLLAFLTAGWNLTLWGDGRVSVFPRAEGELFPGIVPVVLIAAGLAAAGLNRSTWSAARAKVRAVVAWRRWIIRALLGIAAIYFALSITIVVWRPLVVEWGGFVLRATSGPRTMRVALGAATLAALLSPRLRAVWRSLPSSPVWFCFGAAVVASVLAFGPFVRVAGTRLAVGPYSLLYHYVPGFDGLRVPPRMTMIAALFGAVVAAYGARAIAGRFRRGRAMVAGLCAFFLVEATAAPIMTNADPGVRNTCPAPTTLAVGRFAPLVYRYVASLPREAVIVEFPLGEDAWEVQYMYYSTLHWRRMLNGYSGGFPESNLWHRRMLGDPTMAPELAGQELSKSGATHAIVHRAAYKTVEASQDVEAWLAAWGATQVASFGRDVVFVLPAAARLPGYARDPTK